VRHAESEGGTAVQLLASIRVLDITQIMRRSICSMLLADMGADLIKEEPPSCGAGANFCSHGRGDLIKG